MEPLTAALTVVSTFLALILGMLTLGGRFLDWLKDAIVEVMEDTGLIRRGEDGADWPNGWENLPDCLDALYETQKRLIEQEDKRCED